MHNKQDNKPISEQTKNIVLAGLYKHIPTHVGFVLNLVFRHKNNPFKEKALLATLKIINLPFTRVMMNRMQLPQSRGMFSTYWRRHTSRRW